MYNQSYEHLNRLELLKALLLSVVIFLFLFYVVWAVPITILSKVFNITDYFIRNNFFVLLSLGVAVLLLILQIIFIFCNINIYKRIVNACLFFLVITFLYPLVVPYNYGNFADNITLTPIKSLTGFSSLYYLLDLILIVFSVFLVRMVVTKKQSIGLLLFFLVFYSVENIIKYSSITLSEEPNKKYSYGTLPISENKQNVFLFILDSVSPPFMMDSLKNHWSVAQKEWTTDFTYYDNTTALSLGRTMLALPNMIGGYQFSPQEHINTIISDNINTYSIDRTASEYFEDPGYFFSEHAMQSLKKEVANRADISYSYLSEYFYSTSEPLFYSPILSVSVYKFIPYFMKGLLTKGDQWKHKFSYKFFVVDRTLERITKKSIDKGFIHIIHNVGTHDLSFSENPGLAVSQSLSRSVEIIRSIINQLKILDLYDNTKIIVASDHGREGIDKDYMARIIPQKSTPFYTGNIELIETLPSLLMVKDFAKKNDNMQIDSRFLSLADISGMMKSPFLSNSVDYTQKYPPNRVFNIPLVSWQSVHYLMGSFDRDYKKAYKKFISNGMVVMVQVESIKEGVFSTNSYSLSNIIDLPAYIVNEKK